MPKQTKPEQERFDTGAELKRIRGAMSQQEFANLMGIGRNTVVRYESNENAPDAEFLFKLNLLFRIDPCQVILGWKTVRLQDQNEIALLENYRESSDEGKRAIEHMADLAAQSAKTKKTKNV